MFVAPYSTANYYTKYELKNKTVSVPFNANILMQADKSDLILKLKNKQIHRTESVKKLYQLGIDFINEDIDNSEFLTKMDELLNKTNAKQWGALNKSERWYIGNFGMFFDLCGPDSSASDNTDIIEKIKDLANG